MKKQWMIVSGAALFTSGLAFGQTLSDPEKTNDSSLWFEGSYKADFLRLVDGGLERGGRPIGHLDLKLSVDLDKLAGWQDTTAFVNFLHDHGEKFNARRINSLLGVSNIEVPVDTGRLFHAWLQKEWHEGRFSLLGGLYPIDSEFQVLESAGVFIQPPYGPTADLSLTRGPSIFNTSAFGVRAKWQSDSHGTYLQGAVLDGVPGDPAKPKGTHVKFAKGDGTMSIVELGAKADKASGSAKYAIGLWSYSAKVDDLVDLDANGDPVRRRSSGGYILGERNLWQGAQGFDLTGFVRYSATDGYSTPIQSTVSAGMTINAPFAGRPGDTFGLAYTHAKIASRFRALQQTSGLTTTSYESSWELTYRYQASSRLGVQPVAQHYRNPGANAAVPNATVIGTRVEVTF